MTLTSHAATSRGSMTTEAAARLLGPWAQQLDTAGEWRVIKAVLMVVGSESWNACAQLADALGVHPEDQALIYKQIARENQP